MSPSLLEKDEKRRLEGVYADHCAACNICVESCPISGVGGLDIRKVLRLALLEMDQEVIDSKFPWVCTLCGCCEHACPMNVDLATMVRSARSMRQREKVPGVLHKGVQTCLKAGNNVGMPGADFLFLLEDLAAELAEELPGFEVPVDKKGAKYLFTVNSKEPFAEPEDMMHWWRILHAANESWTVASENWEGVNWGLFTGDDAAMKEIVGRVVQNYKNLECEYLVLPE